MLFPALQPFPQRGCPVSFIHKIPNHPLVFKGFLNKASADVQGKSGTYYIVSYRPYFSYTASIQL